MRKPGRILLFIEDDVPFDQLPHVASLVLANGEPAPQGVLAELGRAGREVSTDRGDRGVAWWGPVQCWGGAGRGRVSD